MNQTPTVEQFLAEQSTEEDYVDVVLTRPPGPDSDFVELEDSQGRGLGPSSGADWVDRGDGFAVLRIPHTTDPLASIAESLRQLTEIVVRRDGVDAAEEAQDHAAEQLRQELADLEDKHRSLFDLLADVEKIVKPSTSKVSLEVKAAIEAWKNPAVEVAECVPIENAAETGLQQPAHDADVEQWREYARSYGSLPDEPDAIDSMNRSQIRTMLGIEQPA